MTSATATELETAPAPAPALDHDPLPDTDLPVASGELPQHPALVKDLSAQLEKCSAEDRLTWGWEVFGEQMILSSSFGAQSAVSLHMATQVWPEIPVVLIDTGNLFPETYRFIDEMTDRLGLNLQIYTSRISQSWQRARYGKLWEEGLEGIEKYNYINKVEPMNRAQAELQPQAWVAGLRRQQSASRESLDVLSIQKGIVKIHPIIDWTDRDIYNYLKKHDLPYHPLWHEGFVSIGDVPLTSRLGEGMAAEETRFLGLKRECGLHEQAPPSYDI